MANLGFVYCTDWWFTMSYFVTGDLVMVIHLLDCHFLDHCLFGYVPWIVFLKILLKRNVLAFIYTKNDVKIWVQVNWVGTPVNCGRDCFYAHQVLDLCSMWVNSSSFTIQLILADAWNRNNMQMFGCNCILLFVQKLGSLSFVCQNFACQDELPLSSTKIKCMHAPLLVIES